MTRIHSSAVIEPGAEIADDVEVGPFCHVGSRAKIGPDCRLISHVTVLGNTTLGSDNTIWPQATLGGDPQDLKFCGEDSRLIIGDHNEIRESVTIHLGTANGGGVTRVGNENLFMVGAHIAHDCIIGDHVVLANSVHLAGHICIHDHAVVSGASGVHHFVTIGQYAFIGGMTRVVHDAPPFMILEGNPAKVRGVNSIGLNRHRFPPETLDRLKDAYRRLYRNHGSAGANEPVRTMAQNLDYLQDQYPDDECISILVQSIRDSSIGMYGRYLESCRNDNRRAAPVK